MALWASPAAGEPALTEVAGVRAVCRAGPDAALARALRLEGRAAERRADVLPNPSLVVEHERILTDPGGSETVVGLDVPLRWGGERGLRQDAARARKAAAEAASDAALLEAVVEFRRAYALAAFARARVEVLHARQHELDSLADVIDQLVERGEKSRYDLARHRTQQRLHRSVLARARAELAALEARVEVWVGRAVRVPVTEALRISQAGASTRPTRSAAHPAERELAARARASRLEGSAARRRWVPQPSVFAGYRALSAGGELGHGFTLGLSVPLTVFDHGQAEATEARAASEVAKARLARLERTHRAGVEAARRRLDALRASLGEATSAAGEALGVEKQATRLYRAGELGISELLDAQRAAVEAQLALLDLREGIALAELALASASGTQLDAALQAACGRGQS